MLAIPAVRFAGYNQPQFGNTTLTTLRADYPVLRTMLDLIEIPSATPQPDPKFKLAIDDTMAKMRARVSEKLKAAGVQDDWITLDPHGSLVVKIPASPGYENKRPLMLTAHMDIVAGDETDPTKPVTPKLDGDWITSDGTTTLGSDDKGGLAMIIDNVARLLGNHPLQTTAQPHAGLELLFSPDEESTLESLKQLDTTQFKAKHVLVVDEFSSFKVTTGLASAVDIKVAVSGFPGGHSGDDIDKGRPNALFALMNALKKMGTGVITMKPDGSMPAISKNVAKIRGGRAPNAIPETAETDIFLRSHSNTLQEAELARMEKILANAQRYYRGHGAPNATFKMEWDQKYPAWEGNPNTPIKDWAVNAGKAVKGPNVKIGAVHAAAQASVLANMKNAYGEQFDAVLIGPDIKEAHTVRERCNWQTLLKANQWLGEIIRQYTQA